MIDLEKEAKEYLINKWNADFTDKTGKINGSFWIGVQKDLVEFTTNSKHVQAKILQAKIDVLNELKDEYELNRSIVPACYEKIKEIKQQLNQLTNETNH